jgi:hypothetical protein
MRYARMPYARMLEAGLSSLAVACQLHQLHGPKRGAGFCAVSSQSPRRPDPERISQANIS